MGFALRMRGLLKEEIDSPRGGAYPRPHRLAAQEAPHALRRPATARGDGRAIVRNPQAFLMDEPLSNLDAKLRVEMRAEIRAHAARPRCDDDLRHPRPDRGDDDGRSRGRDEKRVPPADRRPEDALRAAPQPVRRRVHRVAGDEPRRGRRRAVRRDVWVSFGPHRLRVEPETLERHLASRPTTGERSCSGSGPRTWRTPRSCVTHPDRVISVVRDIREDMGSEVYVHFNVPADRCRRGGDRGVRGSRRARMAAERAAAEVSSSSPASSGRRTRGSDSRLPRGRRHAVPLLRSRDRHRDPRGAVGRDV